MNRVDEVLAEGETAFAGGGAGGDEGEEVGIDNALVVDAADFGEAGGEGGEGSKEEDVGVALVVGDFNDAAKEQGQLGADFVGECGEFFLGGGNYQIISVINLIS